MKEILKEFIQSKLDSGEASLGWFGDIKEFEIERYFMNSIINGEETLEMIIVTSHMENGGSKEKIWHFYKSEVNEFISSRREITLKNLGI